MRPWGSMRRVEDQAGDIALGAQPRRQRGNIALHLVPSVKRMPPATGEEIANGALRPPWDSMPAPLLSLPEAEERLTNLLEAEGDDR